MRNYKLLNKFSYKLRNLFVWVYLSQLFPILGDYVYDEVNVISITLKNYCLKCVIHFLCINIILWTLNTFIHLYIHNDRVWWPFRIQFPLNKWTMITNNIHMNVSYDVVRTSSFSLEIPPALRFSSEGEPSTAELLTTVFD